MKLDTLCLSETWCDSLYETENCNYILKGYKSLLQYQLCIYRRDGLSYEIRDELNKCSEEIECLKNN